MINNTIPKQPTMEELIAFATLLDEVGEYRDAEIIDEYIGKCASDASGDFIKSAGFWGNVWNRVKGRTKRMFISEYRDLHDSAKEAQKKLEEFVDKINDDFKKAKGHFKNYQFGEWKSTIGGMVGVDTAALMAPFDEKYAKFIGYVTKGFEEKDESEEESDFDKTTKEKTTKEKTTKERPMSKKDQQTEMAAQETLKSFDKVVAPVEWFGKNIQNKKKGKNLDPNIVRADRGFFVNRVMEKQVVELPDGLFAYNNEYKGKNISHELIECLGDTIWKQKEEEDGLQIEEDKVYVVLENTKQRFSKKIEKELKEEVPVVPEVKPAPQVGRAPAPQSVLKENVPPSVVVPKTQERAKRVEELMGKLNEKKLEPEVPIDVTPGAPITTAPKGPVGPEQPVVVEEGVKLPSQKAPMTTKEKLSIREPGPAVPEAKTEVIAPSPPQTEAPDAAPEASIDVAPVEEPVVSSEPKPPAPKPKRSMVSNAPDGTTWVMYKEGTKHYGKYAPVKNVNPDKHLVIDNPKLVAKLNSQWAEAENKLPGFEYTASRLDRIMRLSNLR